MQRRYYLDEHRFILVSAGRRSRKTLIGKRKQLLKAIRQPETRWFYGAPTYGQAKKIFWDSLKKDTFEFWACRPSESELEITLVNGSTLHIIGLDKPMRIEGQVWHGCHITEFPNLKPDAWEANIRPALADTGGSAILDGVPEMGASWYRDMAKFAAGGNIPTTLPSVGATGESEDKEWAFYSWFSSDVLDAKEIESARRTFDPRLFKQEYEGSFETLEGLVYYAFKADYWPKGNLDKTISYDHHLPLYIGMDFNVSPMTAIIAQVHGDEVHVIKGYHLKNSNTKLLTERIIADYPKTSTFYVTPCQSSSARQTVAELGITDLRILQSIMTNAHKICNIIKRSKNPPIRNRTNAANSKLCTADGTRKVRIYPDDAGCKELIKDFESLTYLEGTSNIDLSEKMRGHISAAFDYFIERHWPVLATNYEVERGDLIV